MKKSICVFLCSLPLFFCSGCNASELTSLKEISKPYATKYECVELSLDGENLKERFDKITLSLEYGGEFFLSMQEKSGKHRQYAGNYALKENDLTFSVSYANQTFRRTFRYEKGVIYAQLPFLGKTLSATFSA